MPIFNNSSNYYCFMLLKATKVYKNDDLPERGRFTRNSLLLLIIKINIKITGILNFLLAS
jgi:hypothetical protein